MKVAILGPLDLEYMGGGETNSMMVANKLSEQGMQVTYFGSGCPLKNIPIERLTDEIKFTYRPSAFKHDPMANPIILKSSSLLSLGLIGMVGKKNLLRVIDQFDIIFFSYPSLMARIVIPYALREGKKVILANHGTFFEYFGNSNNPILKIAKNLGESFLLRPFAADSKGLLIHTQTSFQSSVYRSLGFKDEHIVEVPQNNVDFSEYYVNENKDPFRVVFLGRLAKSKGIDLMVDIIHNTPDVKFSIIGNGPLINKLLTRTRDTDAEILGYVSGKQKREILANSDLMIVPSVFDSLSIAAIEGLASGLPLVTSEIAEGPRYIIEKDPSFGIMSERTVSSFTKAIQHYANLKKQDPVKYLNDKVERRAIAQDIFDAQNVVEKLIAGFSKIVVTAERHDETMAEQRTFVRGN